MIGKVLAFLTLPATLIAGYVYFDEVRDYLSTPEFRTEIKRATLRCNYVWRDAKAYNAYQGGDINELTELCRRSPIAVSFEVRVTNDDSVARELRELSLSATVPPYGELTLDEIQSVEHLIQHGVETNLRRDWQVQTIPSGSSVIFEILGFSSTVEGSEDHWVHLAEMLDQKDPAIVDALAVISFQARVSGFFEGTHVLGSCDIKIDQDEIDQWHKKDWSRRIQITNSCD
ncbi:hypothetical protein [uncultured Tateyamaria sp.]|uniref:hypothetical protein n=1 Tax=uncultured Tateyamaria sp. TaxID=455651 RepID=UPI002639EA94|nr:hypothetical protein [uncultured Tateyamaria sp.]